MSQGKRMSYGKGRELLIKLEKFLTPYCERIEAAGSLRRRASSVGDIELVCIPKALNTVSEADMERAYDAVLERHTPPGKKVTRPAANMFGGVEHALLNTALDVGLFLLVANENIRLQTTGQKNKRGELLKSGLGIDVYVTTPAKWSVTMLVRTGPQEFSGRMLTCERGAGGALPAGHRLSVADGCFYLLIEELPADCVGAELEEELRAAGHLVREFRKDGVSSYWVVERVEVGTKACPWPEGVDADVAHGEEKALMHWLFGQDAAPVDRGRLTERVKNGFQPWDLAAKGV